MDTADADSPTGASLAGLRLVAALNGMDAGVLNPGEAEACLRGAFAWVKDPERLFDMSHRLTLRIGMAQVPRRHPGAWALALVRPGRLGGLRGPVELTRATLATDPDPALAAVPVVVHHLGGLAWHEAREPMMGVGAVDAGGLDDEEHLVRVLRVRAAERPLPPATPSESARALAAAMATAAEAIAASGFTGGERPDPTGTVRLGRAYPGANQALLDRALTVLSIVDAGREQGEGLPHSHAITTRGAALEPLRDAALDAIQSALSWPSHLMS